MDTQTPDPKGPDFPGGPVMHTGHTTRADAVADLTGRLDGRIAANTPADQMVVSANLYRAAKLVIHYVETVAGQDTNFSYPQGEASGAIAVWASILGMTQDPDRAIGLARAHIAAVNLGLAGDLQPEGQLE